MWVWCWPDLAFAAVLGAGLLGGTWFVAEQVGYERGVFDRERFTKPFDGE